MKKILSLVLAVVMILSLGTVAFAEDVTVTPDANGATTSTVQMAGELKIPEISVTMPTTGAVLLNPFRLSVTEDPEEEGPGVASVTYVLSSTTEVALDVAVLGTLKASGDVKIVTAPLAALGEGVTKSKTKDVFVYFAFLNGGDADSTADEFKDYRTELAAGDSGDLSSMLILSEKAAKEATIVGTIEASDGDAVTSAFCIKGEAYAMTVEPWTSKDKVDATLIFSFTPSVDEANAPYAPAAIGG